MPNNKKLRSRKKKDEKTENKYELDYLMEKIRKNLNEVFSPNLPCYHGSTKEAFAPGTHKHSVYSTAIVTALFPENDTPLNDAVDSVMPYLEEPEFADFVVAFYTEIHLKFGGFHDHNDPRWQLFFSLLGLAMGAKSGLSEASRIFRELETKRGIITNLANFIPCDCMKKEKKVAKKCLEKQARCSFCRKLFSSDQLQLCSVCRFRIYCGPECQKKHWPRHKEECKELAARFGIGKSKCPEAAVNGKDL